MLSVSVKALEVTRQDGQVEGGSAAFVHNDSPAVRIKPGSSGHYPKRGKWFRCISLPCLHLAEVHCGGFLPVGLGISPPVGLAVWGLVQR